MTSQNRTGTIAGLLAFLDDAEREPKLHRTTVQAIRSTWRSVTTELGITSDTAINALAPDRLVDAFVGRRGPNFRSGATYRTRLRVGQQLYQAWLADDPHWTDVANTRAGSNARNINKLESRPRPAFVLQFPLRRDLVINLEVPQELTYEEAERIAAIYRSCVVPDGSDSRTAEPSRATETGQEEAPAT